MILLTGAAGFIGKHLLTALIKAYGVNNILALSSKAIEGCQYLLHHDYRFGSDYFIKNGYDKIEVIIHAGAFTPKNAGQANNLDKCNSNIFSTAKLLSGLYPKLKKIIYLSTLDVYGDEKLICENTKISPISLYGDSKFYCEKMIGAWGVENRLTSQILRVGHVYGPGEDAYQKIIPVTIKKLLNRETLQIFGDGEDVRSFIYVTDVVKAIMESIKLEQNMGPINIVGNRKISIKDLVSRMIEISGRKVIIEYLTPSAKKRNLIFDNTKMKKYLLDNEIPLEEGLLEEYDYMKKKGL